MTENINVEVATLQRDVAQISTIVSRIDAAIEKLAEVSASVTTLLAAQDQKITNHEKTTDRLEEDIQDIEKSMLEFREKIVEEVKTIKVDVDIRIAKLERMIYTAIGGGLVILFIADQLFSQFFA